MTSRHALLALVLAASLSPAVRADIVPGTTSDDSFDSTCGTVVVAHDTIVDPINAFTTSGGFEDGHTLMRNGGLGSVSFIDFRTARNTTIRGVRLFAHNDGVPFSFRRAMSRFKLLADLDSDGTAETVVIDVTVNPDYAAQAGNVAVDPTNLDMSLFTVGTVTARNWRLEVTQGSNVPPFEGARLVEVDALGPPCGACATCDELHATIDSLDIDRDGVRNSFHAQADAACRALERGQNETAGNILCAELNHDAAQDGQHVATDSAAALRDCILSFAGANAIPLHCEE